jgi:hypothetical protein
MEVESVNFGCILEVTALLLMAERLLGSASHAPFAHY